jgi:hypothetical protein
MAKKDVRFFPKLSWHTRCPAIDPSNRNVRANLFPKGHFYLPLAAMHGLALNMEKT